MLRKKVWLTPYLFLLGPLVLYVTFLIAPVVGTFGLSFYQWDGLSESRVFVGAQNFIRMVTAPDSLFLKALLHNVWWSFLGTILPISIALPLAALVARTPKGMTLFRVVYFLPMVLPAIVVGIIWGWIYNPVFGLLNSLLSSIGLENLTVAWLGQSSTALTALIVAAAWGYTGFCFVILLAGMQNINIDLYESAIIDGANFWVQFTHITVPLLRNIITMLTAYTLIGGFSRVFDIIWITTRGGPGSATEVLGTYIYRVSFQHYEFGYGAAMSVSLGVIVAAVSYVFVKVRERKDL